MFFSLALCVRRRFWRFLGATRGLGAFLSRCHKYLTNGGGYGIMGMMEEDCCVRRQIILNKRRTELKQNKVFKNGFNYGDHKNNLIESEFIKKAEAHGLVPLSKGWPDFLCFDPETKKIICVEAKPGTQKLKLPQFIMLKILTLAGIECYRYTPQKGMIPFEIDNDLFGLDLLHREVIQEKLRAKAQPDIEDWEDFKKRRAEFNKQKSKQKQTQEE